MKKGPKPLPATVIQMRGTNQPCRTREHVVAHIDGDPEKPKWLKGLAGKIWDSKVRTYLSRGQSVRGCEDALAQYCSLEAQLIGDFWRKKITPPMAMVNAHRIYACEFYETPASQHKPSGGNAKSNPFTRNGIGGSPRGAS